MLREDFEKKKDEKRCKKRMYKERGSKRRCRGFRKSCKVRIYRKRYE
jgi:hypothetical protein